MGHARASGPHTAAAEVHGFMITSAMYGGMGYGKASILNTYPIPIQRVRADSIHGFHFDIHIPYQFNARHPAITGTAPRGKVSQGCMVEAAEALRYIYIYIDVTWRMRKLLSASDPFERAPNPVTSVSRRGLFTQPTLRIC